MNQGLQMSLYRFIKALVDENEQLEMQLQKERALRKELKARAESVDRMLQKIGS